MKSRKIAVLWLPLLVAAATLTAVAAPAHASQVIVSKVATNGAKGYLQVDGKPFTINGVQSFGEWQTFGNSSMNPIPTNQSTRILPQDWLENTFEKTAAAGFNTIQIQLAWNQIEPTTQGVYDWTLLDKYVTWAMKYGLKLDFGWWGANGCGGGILPGSPHGFMTSIPAYLQNQSQYWGTGGNGEEVDPYPPIVGDAHYTDASYLFASERAAVTAMFNHLATYDTSHQTIQFQVYNEPDLATTWSSNYSTWLDLINQLGGAVKNSNYVVATRVNYAAGRLPNGDIGALSNIDYVGPDDYTWDVSDIAAAIQDTRTKNNSKLSYIPETFPRNTYAASVEATALVNGGFVDFWQLNDSWLAGNYSLWGSPSEGYPSYTTWAVGTLPPMPEGVSRLNEFNTGLNKMNQLVAASLPQNMAGFNIATSIPSTNSDTTSTLNGASVRYRTTDGSIGMALYDPASSSYYLISDTRTSATYDVGIPAAVAAVGHFDSSGTWVPDLARTVGSNGDIQINSGELVRVNTSPAAQNLALGQATTASSSYPGDGSAQAVDGNYSTQWAANAGTFPQWLNVDLGTNHNLSSIRQTFAEQDNSTFSYKVEGSTDNSNWTTLVDHTSGILTNTSIVDNVTGSYRWVRLTVTGINQGHWANSQEFEVWSGSQNLALGQATTASSSYPGDGSAQAVDGNYSTQWAANAGTFPQWLNVDLGTNHNLSSIHQTFAEKDNSTFSYKVEGSTDNSNWTTLVDHTSGILTNTSIVDNVTGSYRWVMLTVTGINQGHWANSQEFEVWSGSSQNLALGQATTASSSYPGDGSAQAVDGNYSTQWAANAGTFPQWLNVDLGTNHNLSSIHQTFAEKDNSTFSYKVEGSTDNSNWTTLVDHTSGILTNTSIVDNVTGSYRWVRLTVTGINQGHWANSQEFEVWGQ